MAAYRADIEIGVRGVRYLDELQNKLTQVSKTIEQVNKQNVVIRRTIAGAASAVPMGPGGSGITGASAQAAALAVERRVGEMRRAEAQASLKSVKDRAIAENYISGIINRRLQTKQQELATEQKITAEQQKQAAVALRQRAGSAASNAIIGGAFPLLFGQGAGAALGGGIGGALGGAFGGTLGFGLSLVGTAIGQAIDDAKKLNSELNSLNSNLSSTGSASRTTASDISQLASQLGIAKDEALKLVAAFSEFGSANIREALATSFGAAGGEEAFNALAAAIDNKSTLEAIVKLRDTINDSQAKEALKQLEINGATSANIFLEQRLAELQEQRLVQKAKEITLMDRLLAAAAALGAQGQVIDPAMFGRERAAGIQQGATARKKAQEQALQDARKFFSEVNRLTEKFNTKRTRQGPKPPEDRTASLQADLQAIIEIGNAEDLIRDLRFQNRDLAAVDVELNKALSDIERDRIKQLQNMNYESEKLTVNKIAQARATNAQKEREDKIREIQKRRADDYAAVLRNVEYEIQLTDARIAGTEQQVVIEQKVKDLQRDQTYLSREQIDNYRKLLELANQRKDAEEIANLQRQISATGRGLQAGFIGPAGAAFEQQLAEGKTEARATQIARLTEELTLAQVQAQALESSVMAIGTAFGTAMTTGVAELIKGTKTAQQVFAEFLDAIGSALLDAAAQMIATYVAIGIARIFAGMGGNEANMSTQGITEKTLAPMRQYSMEGPLTGMAGGIGLANGGPVSMGRPYVVGERGPELFLPSTGGNVMSNNDLRSAMGSSSAAAGAPVLNMSFQTTNIGGVEYVSRDQLEQAMAATRRQAASDGAKRGMTMTLDKLQQSPGTRSRVGLR